MLLLIVAKSRINRIFSRLFASILIVQYFRNTIISPTRKKTISLVRKIIFSVKDSDKDVCVPKADYKTYDINKISYFSGYGDFDTYLLFDGSFDSKVGDIVIFDGADDGEKIYIIR